MDSDRQLKQKQQVAEAALAWIEKHIVGKSASSLRFAVTAARSDYVERIRSKLEKVERLYIDELMQTSDPLEGLDAFLEKRTPTWQEGRAPSAPSPTSCAQRCAWVPCASARSYASAVRA